MRRSYAGFTFQRPEHYYYLLVGALLTVYLLAFRLLHSPFGTALQAMRESEVACRTSGVRRGWRDAGTTPARVRIRIGSS